MAYSEPPPGELLSTDGRGASPEAFVAVANRPRRTISPMNALLLAACVLTTVTALSGAYEGAWCPIGTLMTNPRQVPTFGHRLLFVGVGWLFKLAVPALSFRRCWLLSQGVATVFTFGAMAVWVRKLVGSPLIGVGSLALTVMLIPTIGYCTFYDVAMIGFYSLCLILLAEKHLLLYLTIYAVALTNHENILLLLPVAVLYLWSYKRWTAGTLMGVAQALIYVAYRLAIRHFLPSDLAFHWNLYRNLRLEYEGRGLLLAAAALLLPFVGTAIGFQYAPRLLKISVVGLFPGLLLVTVLFGQVNEPRQFDAMFALAVPSILCALRQPERSDGGSVG